MNVFRKVSGGFSIQKILICFILSTVVRTAGSQSLRVTPKSGLGISMMEGSFASGGIKKNSWQFGALLGIGPQEALFSLRTGVLFQAKGGSSIDVYHLTFPAMFHFNIGRSIKFFPGGGVYYSLLLSYKNKFHKKEFDENKQGTEYGFLIDLSFSFPFHPGLDFFAGIELQNALSPAYSVISMSSGGSTYEDELYSTAIYFSVGVVINLSRQESECCD